MIVRKLSELEEANLRLHGGQKAVDDAKNLIKENLTVVTPTPQTPEEKGAEEWVNSLLERGMDLMYQEALEALALNPADDEALLKKLQYQQWRRNKQKNKDGILKIIRGHRVAGQRPTGIWTKTRDHGWLLKVPRAKVGDLADIKKRGGITVAMELVEEVATGYFKGKAV
jgi:hypothetical protein